MPQKKNNKKVKKNTKITKKQMEKVARQTAYKMIPRKLFAQDSIDTSVQTNSSPWLVILPTAIGNGLNNYERLSDNIFLERCSGFFNISFSGNTLNRVEVREMVGFYKGTTNYTSGLPAAAFGPSILNADLPSKRSRYDRDNYLIKHDRQYDLMPEQVYEATPGQPQGLWRSKMIKLNLPMYRKITYTDQIAGGNGDAAEGNYATGDRHTGWKPFIALQIRCPDQDFTGSGGSNPGPYVDYKFTTYFKDL